MILTPGPMMEIAPMISIKADQARPKASLYMTTVYSDMDARIPEIVQAQLSGDALLLPKRDVVPHNMSNEEYSKLVQEMMDESKTVAKVIALQQLGYSVEATGEGARVQQILPGSTAGGVLQVGDVVVEAAGQPIRASTELVNIVRKQTIGEVVRLGLRRGEERVEVEVRTKESDSEPGIAVMGVMVTTYRFGHNLPVNIEIDSENVGGPSAGLMFTLGIIDALDPAGLAPGHKVAGTGTISLDGSIGPVGGVGQKVIGAEASGAEFFLAPSENFETASKAAKRIKVIDVGSAASAVSYLRTLTPSVSAAGQP